MDGLSMRQIREARETLRELVRWGRDHVEAGNLATAVDYLRAARAIRTLLGGFGLRIDPNDLASMQALQSELNAAAVAS